VNVFYGDIKLSLVKEPRDKGFRVTASNRVHPELRKISDGLAFRLARLVVIHEKNGAYWFKKSFDITVSQWRILGITHEMEPVAFRCVQETLNIDKGQLSRLLKVMTQKDLLTVKQSEKDARSVRITTTKAGKKLHAQVLKFSDMRNELIVSSLTKHEFLEFVRVLEKITKYNMKQSN
jgi:DNA-binding MarR family transcriptional regulator